MQNQLPPAIRMLELATQFWNSQCVYVAAKLGIADLLAEGPLTPSQIAAEAGAQPDVLARVLRALASLGVFAEDGEGRFGLTAVAETLRRDHPSSTRGVVLMAVEDLEWKAWGALEHAVRTGETGFGHEHGMSRFEYMRAHPDCEPTFAAAMTSISATQTAAIAAAYPFDRFKTLADVGGGNGHLLAAILRRFPKLNGVLFDQPNVVDGALSREIIGAPDISGRAQAVGGDVFAGVPQAEGYILKNVIHDWSDDEGVAILRSVRAAMPDNGTLLLAEGVIKPGNGPDWMKFSDLAMFMDGGGRERSQPEFDRILDLAGFRRERTLPTASALSIIEAVKTA